MRRKRNRTAVILGFVVLLAFAGHWALDGYICNPKTWKYRPPQSEGQTFLQAVFRGGGGTPAIFAMLGGQRTVVAGILWSYQDILFHQGRPYEIVQVLESCVTLDPRDGTYWSYYGWHLAWNLYIYTDDVAKRAYWAKMGENVYLRAKAANPDMVLPYSDLAWFYMVRRGDYDKAREYYEDVVLHPDTFKPKVAGVVYTEDEDAQRWDPVWWHRRLGIVYLKLAVRANHRLGDQEMFDKALEQYQGVLQADPKDSVGLEKVADITAHRRDAKWVADQRHLEFQHAQTFGLDPSIWAPLPPDAPL